MSYGNRAIVHSGSSKQGKVPLCSLAELKLRFLCPSDLPEVKTLCRQWFPIEYPDVWYEDITTNPRFYALAATYHSQIVGLLVAETKPLAKMNKEDQDILPPTLSGHTQIGYILTLGVTDSHRGHGIASLLLDNYLAQLTTQESPKVQAVLLHVLTTNQQAINFYQRRNFVRHTFLPYYYNIKGKPKDGFSYVRYVNGGHPPWTLLLCTALVQCSIRDRSLLVAAAYCFQVLGSHSKISHSCYDSSSLLAQAKVVSDVGVLPAGTNREIYIAFSAMCSL